MIGQHGSEIRERVLDGFGHEDRPGRHRGASAIKLREVGQLADEPLELVRARRGPVEQVVASLLGKLPPLGASHHVDELHHLGHRRTHPIRDTREELTLLSVWFRDPCSLQAERFLPAPGAGATAASASLGAREAQRGGDPDAEHQNEDQRPQQPARLGEGIDERCSERPVRVAALPSRVPAGRGRRRASVHGRKPQIRGSGRRRGLRLRDRGCQHARQDKACSERGENGPRPLHGAIPCRISRIVRTPSASVS